MCMCLYEYIYHMCLFVSCVTRLLYVINYLCQNVFDMCKKKIHVFQIRFNTHKH